MNELKLQTTGISLLRGMIHLHQEKVGRTTQALNSANLTLRELEEQVATHGKSYRPAPL